MRCEFQSLKELMEYIEKEAWRRAKEILRRYGIEVDKLELNYGALAGM